MELGLLQREVAETLGVNVWTILNWERGKTAPAKQLRALVCGFLRQES